MTISKYQVFLASRFKEFSPLRSALKNELQEIKQPPVEAIDLNDNEADPNPPLGRCYEAVDESNLFVLLLGETYGGKPKNQTDSYTHLEYKRAKGQSKPILIFVIGNGYEPKPEIRQFKDDMLNRWLTELEELHTPSYFDWNLGPELLARRISGQIRNRLVELYLDDDISELDEDVEESKLNVEDMVIKRSQLASAPWMSAEERNGNHPLKNLARGHAREALRALNLGLPNVAIHHLRQAVEMVPLDVTLGYWLARLLVARGGRKDCVKGQRTARRCAQIAATDPEQLKLEMMACLVTSARASERLGELEVAKDDARRAHDKVPYHWIAKIEYARQLLLSGENHTGFRLAGEAFWLRPPSILKIQSDATFRDSADDFKDFRVNLQKVVDEEVEKISKVDGCIREFASNLSIASPAMTRLKVPNNEPDKWMYAVLEAVQNGHHLMQASLQNLQRCAAKLTAANNAFTFNSERGLSPEVKAHIADQIRGQQLDADKLNESYAEAMRQTERLQKQQTAVIIGGIIVAVIFFTIAMIGIYAGGIVVVLLAVLVILLDLTITIVSHQSLGLKRSTTQRTVDNTSHELQLVRNLIAESSTAMQSFKARETELQRNISMFCDLVDQFEANGLKRIPFSPAPPIDRKTTKELARADSDKVLELGLQVDSELLPNHFRAFRSTSTPKSKYWLARRAKIGAAESWSRSAAYFQMIEPRIIWLSKDGRQTGPFLTAEARRQLNTGQVQSNDQAWYDESTGWVPLSSVLNHA